MPLDPSLRIPTTPRRPQPAPNGAERAPIGRGRRRNAGARTEPHRRDDPDLTLAALRHDLNNLLTVALCSAEQLALELPKGSEAQALAESCLAAAERAAELVERINGHPGPPRPETADCAAAAETIANLVRPTAAGVEVRCDVRTGLRCAAERVGLERALLNLCQNALQAMPRGGGLWLEAEAVGVNGDAADGLGLAPGAYVRLTVRDTGVGMSAEVLARAAEPYFSAAAGRAGRGLGLASVGAFAEAAGGRLTLASRAGEGACVSLYLPRAHD